MNAQRRHAPVTADWRGRYREWELRGCIYSAAGARRRSAAFVGLKVMLQRIGNFVVPVVEVEREVRS